MVATMKTLATRKLAFWPKASSTHLPLAARKPTTISRTSITIFSSTTSPAMVSLLSCGGGALPRGAGGWPASAGGPVGTVAGSNLRRGPPPLSGAGIQAFSMRKPGRKESQGGTPCTPEHKTARWGSLHLLGCVPSGAVSFWLMFTRPDLETHFRRICFGWILLCGKIQSEKISKKKVSKSGHVHGLQSNPLPSRCAAIPKDGASEQRAALKYGSRAEPWCSFLHFSHEKWRPPAGTPPGALRPEAGKSLDHP